MSIFLTSDTHFNNDNIIKYCDRPFFNHKDMNETLITNWNSVVKPEDTVYHLGDFIMGLADNTASILHRLNGHIEDYCSRCCLPAIQGTILCDVPLPIGERGVL